MTCAELFIEALKESNKLAFDVDRDEDGYIVEIPYDGKTAACIFNGEEDKYLSIYLLFEKLPEDKVGALLCTCNVLNSKYKWVRFFVDSDHYLVLELDALLCPSNAASATVELLLRMFRIVDEVKPIIMKKIYG